jgi:hypothetical protein
VVRKHLSIGGKNMPLFQLYFWPDQFYFSENRIWGEGSSLGPALTIPDSNQIAQEPLVNESAFVVTNPVEATQLLRAQ